MILVLNEPLHDTFHAPGSDVPMVEVAMLDEALVGCRYVVCPDVLTLTTNPVLGLKSVLIQKRRS